MLVSSRSRSSKVFRRSQFRASKVANHVLAAERNQATIAVIGDVSTPGGKALQLLLNQLDGRAHWHFGKDLESFKAWPRLADVDVLVPAAFAGGRADVIEELWPLCPKIRWVHSLSAGVELFVPVLKSLPRGPETPLTNAKGAFSRSLAEYALGAMLHFNKQVPRLQANRTERRWDKFIMAELHGQTVGFVGFGDIAQSTARLCKAFGMHVLALRNSPDADSKCLADQIVFGQEGKHRVFAESDHIVCSLPGGKATYHFCGSVEFEAMKASSVFISLGRGTAVDETALVPALREGKIRGAALDVFELEPLPSDSPLWDCENLLLSAHNADLTADYFELTVNLFLKRLGEYSSPDFLGFNDTVDLTKGY